MATAPIARGSTCDIPSRPRFLNLLSERADTFMAGPACPASDHETGNRLARKLLWVEGLFSNASESFVTSFITPFALSFGATNGQIGALSSATNVASALGLLPGARLEEHLGHRKWIFMISTGIVGRLLLIALVLLPLFLRTPGAFYGILAVVVLRSFLNQLSYPAWSALLTDLVPEGIRGRYFGSRNIAVSFAALICTPLAGYLINEIGSIGYQLSFGIAAGAGFLATAVFGMVKEPRDGKRVRERKRASIGIISAFTDHPRFAAFTGLAFLWHLSLQAAGPFFAVYQMQRLGANVAHIGILGSVGAFTGIVGQRLWGIQNDRRGPVWVMRITGFLIPVIPFSWAIVPSWGYLPLIEAVSGFVWAGYWLASFNLLLKFSPDGSRSRFVAIHQSVVAVASFIGPVLGGIMVSMISIKGLFWVSGMGRLTVSLLFLFLISNDTKEPIE